MLIFFLVVLFCLNTFSALLLLHFLYFGICNWFQSKINLRKSKISLGQTLHYLIIGDESDEQFVRSILDTNKVAYEISKRVDPNDRFSEVEIRELVKVLSIDEIIFSSEKFQTLEVLDYISKLGSIVSYKIKPTKVIMGISFHLLMRS